MKFKTKPFKHQLHALTKMHLKTGFALFMEMGTGKSKVIIDDAHVLYEAGQIDAVIIVCPNGLQQNWINRELPTHMTSDYVGVYFGKSKKEQRAWLDVFHAEGKLKVFAINVDRLIQKETITLLMDILKDSKTMLVVDESQRIKNPKAKRTKALLGLAPHAAFRRVLSGTPITQGALDLFSQLRFLSTKILPFSTYTAYKHQYAVVQRIKTDKNRYGFFEKVTGYKNLDQLKGYLEPVSYIVKKEECLDLPDKVYENIDVEMTAQQKRVYKQLVAEAIAVIEQPPENMSPEEHIMWALQSDKVVATNGLTAILRCQQVLGGYVKDETEKLVALDSNRLKVLMETIDDIANDAKIIIWSRFVAEIEEVSKALKEKYGEESTVEYYGAVKAVDRDAAVDNFQSDPKTRFFIAQPASGGVGLTLTAASYVVWYSMDYSLEHYLQANDRAHRIGQTRKVTYLHLVCPKTLDEAILRALKTKSDLAEEII